MRKQTGKMKPAVRLIGVLLLAVLLFSILFVVAEAEHDCTHEDCPICACIRNCESLLHQFFGITLAVNHALVLSAILLSVAAVLVFSYTQASPVSNKVRLNN